MTVIQVLPQVFFELRTCSTGSVVDEVSTGIKGSTSVITEALLGKVPGEAALSTWLQRELPLVWCFLHHHPQRLSSLLPCCCHHRSSFHQQSTVHCHQCEGSFPHVERTKSQSAATTQLTHWPYKVIQLTGKHFRRIAIGVIQSVSGQMAQ